MKKLKLLNKYSYLHSINGSLIEAELDDVSVGEVCEIYASWQANERIARAQVVGFRNGKTLLNLIGSSVGLTRTAVLKPTGEQLTIQISDAFLGSVLNASGQIMERFVPDTPGERGNLRLIDELPPSYQERRVINTPLETRIRVIDGVLTCGIGQRVGIFASAGCGKTVLMHMLVNNTEADVFVIGLIGERGREVTECAESLKKSVNAAKCVLVYATSDFSSVDRCNAALMATTVAEYFRDRGKRVVLFIDSMTRYARALRDMKLAAGEPTCQTWLSCFCF